MSNKLCGRRGCGRHGMPTPACNNPTAQLQLQLAMVVDSAWGRLKTRDWKTRDHQKCRGGKRRTGKHGTIIPGVENAISSYGKPKLQVYLVITNA